MRRVYTTDRSLEDWERTETYIENPLGVIKEMSTGERYKVLGVISDMGELPSKDGSVDWGSERFNLHRVEVGTYIVARHLDSKGAKLPLSQVPNGDIPPEILISGMVRDMSRLL